MEQVNQKIGNERPVKHYITSTNYHNCKLYFFSAEVKEILKTYGLVPNKTYSKDFCFPFLLQRQYWKDYLRGYFDGDGCIKLTGNTLTFQIDGTNYSILKQFQDYLKADFNIDTHIYKDTPEQYPRQTVDKYRIYAYANNALKIFELIYADPNCIKLQRKFDKYLTYKK